MTNIRLSSKPQHVSKLKSAGYSVSDASLNAQIADVYVHGVKDIKTFCQHQAKIQGILGIPADWIEYT